MKRKEVVDLLLTGNYVLTYDNVSVKFGIMTRDLRNFIGRVSYNTGIELRNKMVKYKNNAWSSIETYKDLQL